METQNKKISSKSIFSKRYTQVYLLLGTFVLGIAVLNFTFNRHIIQKRIAHELHKKAGIDLDFEDITLQIFTGTLSGKKIALHITKNNLRLTLKKFRVNFNPVFFLIGQIKINTVLAEEVFLDTSDLYREDSPKPSRPLPAFLREIRLKHALISKITWDQGVKGKLMIGHFKITSRFGGLITKSPALMLIQNITYRHPKFDIFMDKLIQDGFFIFDFSQPRFLDESRLVSRVSIKGLVLGIKKREKSWLTNRGWDTDLDPVLHRHYGDDIPEDRSYLYVPKAGVDITRSRLSTLIQSFVIHIGTGHIMASGHWNHFNNNIGFRLEADDIPMSRLPFGQSQIRTAFKTLNLTLTAKGKATGPDNLRLALTLDSELSGNLVNPPAGDLKLLAAGHLLNTSLSLSPLRFTLGDGGLSGRGSLDLAKLITDLSFTFDNFDIETVLRLFSTQNIPAMASGSGTLSGKVTIPKIHLQMSSPDAMYEFLHFGAAEGQLHIENNDLKLVVGSQNSDVGTSHLEMSIRDVFDPFTQELTLKSTHENIDIKKLLRAQSLDATVSGDFQLSRKNAVVTASGEFAARDFTFFEIPIGNIKTGLSLNRKHLNVAPITLDLVEPQKTITIPKGFEFDFDDSGYRFVTSLIPEFKINGTFRKADRQHMDLDLQAEKMPLEIFTSLLPVKPETSSITGRVHVKYAIYDPIDSRFQGAFTKIEAKNRDGAIKLMRAGSLDYSGRSFVFQNFDLEMGRGRFVLDGPLSLEKSSQLKIHGKVDFNLISDFNPFIAESDNPIELDVTMRGSRDKPQFFGKVILDHDSIVFRNTPNDFEDMTGTIHLEGARIRFDSLNLLYDDAPLSLNGWITTDYEQITGAELKLDGREVPLHMASGFNGLADLDLKLTGSVLPVLSGTINIVDGQFQREFGLNNFILKPISDDVDEESSWGMISPQTPLSLSIKNTGDFLMKSSIATLELGANLDVTGHADKPLLDGQIDILAGEINAFGVDFEDATGYVHFRRRAGINPDISLTAKKEIQEYEILARITGQLTNMKLNFNSTPSLDRREILSVLFFGQTPDQLVGERRRQFTQAAAITQLASVLSKPIHQLSGLDVVEVHSRQDRANQTVQRLSVGKRLSSRFNLNFTTDIGIEDPERAFEMQFQVFDNFYLIAAKDIGDRNRYRFDLSLKFEQD